LEKLANCHISISAKHDKNVHTSVVAVQRRAVLINLADLQTQAAQFHTLLLHLKEHPVPFSQTNDIIISIRTHFYSNIHREWIRGA